jgi:hypothetical protein
MFNGMEAMEAVASSVLDEHSFLVFMHKYIILTGKKLK